MGREEHVDLVDGRDRVIGTATIEECLGRGLLHRAVAVMVRRRSGMFLIQQRSKEDLWQSGLWTLSCTGHVKSGETYAAAARRELMEELGLDAPVRRRNKFLIPPIKEGPRTEREWVTLFTATTDAPVTIDPIELEGVKEVTAPELRSLVRRGPLTPDSRMILRHYLKGISAT